MLTFVLLSICVGLAVYMFLRQDDDASRLPPGPKGLPFVGSGLSLDSHIHFTFAKWAKIYGDIFTFRLFPGMRGVVVSSADMIRETLTKPNDAIMSSRPPTFVGHYLLSESRDVVFSPNVDPNYVPRRKAVHRLLKLYGEGGLANEDVIIQEVQTALDRYDQTGGKPFVPHDIMAEMVWHIIGRLLLGDYYEKDDKLFAAASQFNKNLLDLLITPNDGVLAYMPWLRHIPGLKYRKMYKDGDNAARYMESCFDDMMKRHDPGNKTKAPGILQSLRGAENDVDQTGKFKFNRKEISGITRNVTSNGFSTTAYTMNIMMRVLLNYPDVQKKVQEEIDSVLGSRLPSLKDRYDMPYTQATILELTRYGHALPYGIPHCATEDVMFHGYLIPKNCMIFHNMYSALRDERDFKNGTKFDPTRYLEEDGSLIPGTHRTRRMTLPFGFGKRQCTGEVFTKSRIFLFLVMMLQKFTLVPVDPNDIPSCQYEDFGPGFLLQVPKFPLRMLPRTQ